MTLLEVASYVVMAPVFFAVPYIAAGGDLRGWFR